MVELFQQLA